MSRFFTLLGKELRIEARAREMLAGGLLLILLTLVVANLAWRELENADLLAAGVLWISFVFAGTLSVSRNLHRERDQGTWEALTFLPVDWGTIYLVKVVANLVVLLVLEALALPVYAVLFDYDVWDPLLPLATVLLLGTLGFAAAATFLAALSSHARAREILLPILLFPLLLPLLMMTLQATEKILRGAAWGELVAEHQILAAFDAIFLAVGWLMFDHVLVE